MFMSNLLAGCVHRRRVTRTVENFERSGKPGGFARRETRSDDSHRSLGLVAARNATARHEERIVVARWQRAQPSRPSGYQPNPCPDPKVSSIPTDSGVRAEPSSPRRKIPYGAAGSPPDSSDATVARGGTLIHAVPDLPLACAAI